MENDERVVDIQQAQKEAYAEDVGRSLESGKTPAMVQRMEATMQEFAQYQSEYAEAVRNYSPNNNQSEVAQDASTEAEQSLQDAPSASDKSSKKPSLFTRISKRVKAPFKKAGAMYNTARQSLDAYQIRTLEQNKKLAEMRIEQQQARIEELQAAEARREAQREAFKETIKESTKNLKAKFSRGVEKTVDVVKGIQNKGRSISQSVANVGYNVSNSFNETKSVVSDAISRGKEGIENVREDAQERRVIDAIEQRMRDKHLERREFNRDMERTHGKKVGSRPLELDSSVGTTVTSKFAAEETKDFITKDENGDVQVDRMSPAYHQYLLEMHAEQSFANADGDIDSIEYRDRAKELYEFMLQENGEVASKQELNEVMLESYSSSFKSKRLKMYLDENPSLTDVDSGLTEPTLDGELEYDMDVETYYTGADEEQIVESDSSFDMQEHRQKTNNKEFNDVPIPHEGFVDVNQEEIAKSAEKARKAKVISLAAARSERSAPDSAVAPANPSNERELAKQALRMEKKHTTNALESSKAEQLTLDLGMKDGPTGPTGP